MNNPKTIGTRDFVLKDQLDFGQFSGDLNPIHIDPISARRTLHGVCIVHGMHAVLWALDQLALNFFCTTSVVKVRFSKPLILDCITKCVFDEKLQKIIISQNDKICVIMNLKLEQVTPNYYEKKTLVPRHHPADVDYGSFSVGDTFNFDLYKKSNYKKLLFPRLSKLYGDILVAEIAGLSQIVGMECPGNHSLFASLSLELCSLNERSSYKIIKMDDRLDLIHIKVYAHSFEAILECFFRPKPIKNLLYKEILKLVSKNEFTNINALIIGGSRGLGECTAKIISAGGGKSFITYMQGATDAASVEDDINASGGFCKKIPLDINDIENLDINFVQLNINHIYYFASPKISLETDLEYNVNRVKYDKFFIINFKLLCEKVLKEIDKVTIFYPSTTYIDTQKSGYKSYIKSKLGGEALSKKMVLSYKELNIICSRLPPLQTDQNQTIISTEIDVSLNSDTLLPIVREMNNYL